MNDFYILVGLAVLVCAVVLISRQKRKSVPPDLEQKKEDAHRRIVVGDGIKKTQKVIIVKDGVRTEGELRVMPQGLQVFSADGKVTLDVTNGLVRFLGSIVLEGSREPNQWGFAAEVFVVQNPPQRIWWFLDVDDKDFDFEKSVPSVTYDETKKQFNVEYERSGTINTRDPILLVRSTIHYGGW